jgi:hypothetical protein
MRLDTVKGLAQYSLTRRNIVVKSRDDFSDATKRILGARAGFRCSNPSCRALTSGPQEDPVKAVNLGVAAHICAAAPGGPRFDPGMTSQQRMHVANGIWLCQNCAKLIDNDPFRFTATVLDKWKAAAEEQAHAFVGKTVVLWKA